MRGPGVAGARSIAAARGRLDRVGRVPVSLRGPGPLGVLAGEPLAALTVEGPTAVAVPVLEDALARVESPGVVPHPIRAPLARAASAGRSGRASVPGATAVPDLASALVPRPVRRSQARPPFADPSSSSIADDAPRPVEGSRPVGAGAPEPAAVLSRSARLGAATPVAMPAARSLSGAELVARPSRAPEAEAAPTSPGGRAHARSQPAAEPAETSVAAAGTAIALPRTSPAAPPSLEPQRTAAGLPAPASAAAADPPEPGASLSAAPIEGLSGLVSWWDARGEPPAAGAARDVPASTRGAIVSRSAVADPEREAPRTAEGAFEGSPLVRLSLRSALEELLLAEARASGIEVHP